MTILMTGMGVVSPLGIGNEDFSKAVCLKEQGFQKSTPENTGDRASEGSYLVDDFDIVKILGKRKGTRILDRTAAFAVGASALAIQDRVNLHEDYSEDDLGIVLGTLNGSISQVVEFLELTRNQAEPWMVSPEGFPNTVMNFSAGQCSIWHKAKAVNTTIVGGTLAGMLSIRYAKRMLEFGHAKSIIAGSVEEYCEFSDQAVQATRRHITPVTMGEGGAMFSLEQSDMRESFAGSVHAELLACEVDFIKHPEKAKDEIINCIYKTLDLAQVKLGDISVVVESGARRQALMEEEALDSIFGDTDILRYNLAQHMGYAISGTSSLQIAALIALINQHPANKVGVAVCTSAGGNIGVCVVRGAAQ